MREYQIAGGRDKYSVLVNWTSTLQRHKRYYSAVKYVHSSGADKGIDLRRLLKARFPRRPSQNPMEVSAKNVKSPPLLSVAQNVVFDTFLIMNIAAPGCCNFYKASLLGDKIEPNVSLLHHPFESLVHVSLKEGWPPSSFLNLDQVISWYHSVRQGALQIPSNPMERVLFALFHISKIEMSPVEIIWLFYAFESLLQTSVGQNFALIVKRLCLLLDASEEQASILRKRMRALYDFRSAIAHGGYEITHPMHDEGLDKRVIDSFAREMRILDFGYALLVAAIQKTILNGWRYPVFSEAIHGERVATQKKILH